MVGRYRSVRLRLTGDNYRDELCDLHLLDCAWDGLDEPGALTPLARRDGGQAVQLWLRIGWLAVCVYLLLSIGGELLYLWRWVVETDSPVRHELLLGVSIAALWGAPAVLLVLVLSWLPIFRRDYLPSRVARLLAALVLILWGGAVLAAGL